MEDCLAVTSPLEGVSQTLPCTMIPGVDTAACLLFALEASSTPALQLLPRARFSLAVHS